MFPKTQFPNLKYYNRSTMTTFPFFCSYLLVDPTDLPFLNFFPQTAALSETSTPAMTPTNPRAAPPSVTSSLKTDQHLSHCFWETIPWLSSRKLDVMSYSLILFTMDHKNLLLQLHAPRSFQYPSLQHQQAFPMNTLAEQVMKTGSSQPSDSPKKFSERKQKPRNKTPTQERQIQNQNLNQ